MVIFLLHFFLRLVASVVFAGAFFVLVRYVFSINVQFTGIWVGVILGFLVEGLISKLKNHLKSVQKNRTMTE